MKKLVILLLLLSVLNAEFILESVQVTASNIQPDGTADISENIKFLVKGNNSKMLYDGGFKKTDDLSLWSANIGLPDVRQHVNPAYVSISNFRLQPQPRSGCNPLLDLCHGALLIEYKVRPAYNNSKIINGTGLFYVDNYKPRTTRFILNPNALSFTNTESGNVLLEPDVYFIVQVPQDAKMIEVNPPTKSTDISGGTRTLSWTDMVLVQFSLIFEEEESIDKEVGGFFANSLSDFQGMLRSQNGLAFLAILAIMVGSYIYINVAKKKKEE